MRQVLFQVPQGQGQRVLEVARRHAGTHLAAFSAVADGQPIDLALVHVSNAKVEDLLDELQLLLPELQVVLQPSGVLPLEPPQREAPEQLTDVSHRSPIEVFLGGLQSVGSWKGFVGYAVAAGIIVWIGLYTNTSYLLVAAMLIAPFAGPAMNTALATARGDAVLLRRGLLRYIVSLAITILVAWLLSMLLGQSIATDQMVQQSALSSVAVLLPLVAGAAGALNLCQSERNSLVTGAATGMLIAASLAPPAGLIGMSAAIGEWEMVISGAFVLVLQLVGINAAGAAVFRLFGLSASGPRYRRGRRWVGWTAWTVSLLAVGALLTMQLWRQPDLQRSTRQQRAAAEVQRAINTSGIAELIEADVRFPRADVAGQTTLLVVTYVQPASGADLTDQQIEQRTRDDIRRALQPFNVTPRIQVRVLRP